MDAQTIDWRNDRAISLGLTTDEADWFASSTMNLHDLAEYVNHGCHPATALRILAPL